MNIKFLKLSIIMTIAMVVMSACEKDSVDPGANPGGNDSINTGMDSLDFSPFVMTYEDFITPNDVQIISSDTTLISVSSAFAEKMGIIDFENRPVTIWRTIGTVPFVRIIKDAKVESDKIILTTTRGEFCDMFKDLEVSLVSDLYVDRDYVPKKITRAGTDEEVTDISGKYIDSEGVYHPAVVIFDKNSPIAQSIKTRTGTDKNYFTAEEYLENNLTWDMVNLNTDFEFDYKYPSKPKDGESNFKASAHIKGKVGVSARLSAYANLSIGFFKINKLETGVRGSAGATAKVSVLLQEKLKKEWEQDLAFLGETSMVFWLGWVPVPFTVVNTLKQKTEASASASVELYASGKYTLDFEKGCAYDSGNGWRSTSKESKVSKSFKFEGVRGTAKAETNTGTYYEVGFYLCGCAGPTLSFGPSIGATAEVEAKVNTDAEIEVKATANAYAGLSGEVGAKVKVFSYKLAEWKTTFDLLKVTLFDGSLSWKYTEDSWGTLKADWTNIMTQDSDTWTWDE